MLSSPVGILRSLRCQVISGAGDPRVTSQLSSTGLPEVATMIPLSGTGLTSGLTEREKEMIEKNA